VTSTEGSGTAEQVITTAVAAAASVPALSTSLSCLEEDSSKDDKFHNKCYQSAENYPRYGYPLGDGSFPDPDCPDGKTGNRDKGHRNQV